MAAACLLVEVRPYYVAVAGALLHRIAADFCNEHTCSIFHFSFCFCLSHSLSRVLMRARDGDGGARFSSGVNPSWGNRARFSHVLSASSFEKSQEISAMHEACCILHSWLSPSSSLSGLVQLFLSSLDLTLTPGPQLELHGDHMDQFVYRSTGHFCGRIEDRLDRWKNNRSNFLRREVAEARFPTRLFCAMRFNDHSLKSFRFTRT